MSNDRGWSQAQRFAHGPARYLWAVSFSVLGLAATLFFERYLGVPDGLIFALVVVVCARYLGTGPALLVSALSIVAIDITMLPPLGSVEFTHPETITHLSVFLVLALVINGATHSLKVAREHADADALVPIFEAALGGSEATLSSTPRLRYLGAFAARLE